MDTPTMAEAFEVARDTQILPCSYPIPGLGLLAVNGFVIRAAEPVLVDTGCPAVRDDFMKELRKVIDVKDIRWIWLTHTDADHMGSLTSVLEEAPDARLVTTFIGLGKLGVKQFPISPERVYLLNPGQTLDVGDRRLLAVKPPCFDAPETTGLYDTHSGALFSADCFGALTREPRASAGDLPAGELREGLVTWATVDSPWLSSVDPRAFGRTLDQMRALEPRVVLSAHLPPAPAMLDTLLGHLESATKAEPFVGPDQEQFRKMLEA